MRDRAARIAPRAGAGLALAAALLAAGCGSPRSSSAPPGTLSASLGGNSVALLKAESTPLSGRVLSDGTGFTLYWFARDSRSSSACSGVCLSMWPPVTGAPRPAAGAVLPGRLATIARPGGVLQATYDGHPLYTFAGDFEPGDVGGDGVSEFGGLWHAVRPG